jgi:hypothetical protein
VEPLRRKERQGNSGTIKVDGFLSFTPLLNANLLFCRFFKNLTLCMTKLRVLVLSFPDFTDISIVLAKFGNFWKFLPNSSYNRI